MYRKPNGKRGFSFTRFANAAVPNFFEDPSVTTTAALAPMRRDMLYAHQLVSQDPYVLNETSFYVAGIVENESMSRKVLRRLKQIQILDEAGLVDTHMFNGKQFIHQMAVLNVNRQRDLIDMLFWWEEEVKRLSRLKEEETEISEAIRTIEAVQMNESAGSESQGDRDGALDELKFVRETVRMRIRQRPSERLRSVEEGRDDLLARARSSSVAVMEGLSAQGPGELPPAYYK